MIINVYWCNGNWIYVKLKERILLFSNIILNLKFSITIWEGVMAMSCKNNVRELYVWGGSRYEKKLWLCDILWFKKDMW